MFTDDIVNTSLAVLLFVLHIILHHLRVCKQNSVGDLEIVCVNAKYANNLGQTCRAVNVLLKSNVMHVTRDMSVANSSANEKKYTARAFRNSLEHFSQRSYKNTNIIFYETNDVLADKIKAWLAESNLNRLIFIEYPYPKCLNIKALDAYKIVPQLAQSRDKYNYMFVFGGEAKGVPYKWLVHFNNNSKENKKQVLFLYYPMQDLGIWRENRRNVTLNVSCTIAITMALFRSQF